MSGKVRVNKYSPRSGFMYDIDPVEVTLTKKAANKRKYLLTKTDRSNGMFEELIRAIEAHELNTESDLAATLKSQGVSDKGIEVARAIARLSSAYSDEIGTDVLAASLNVSPSSDDAAEEEPISKSDLEALPEAVRKSVERVLQENAEMAGKVDTLASEFAKTVSERKLSQYVSKAASLEALSASAEDIGAILKNVSDAAGDDVAGKVLEILRSANEVAATAGGEVFKSHGSSRDSGTDDVYERVETLAREKMQKSAEPLGLGAAMEMVFAENPELARQYNG